MELQGCKKTGLKKKLQNFELKSDLKKKKLTCTYSNRCETFRNYLHKLKIETPPTLDGGKLPTYVHTY